MLKSAILALDSLEDTVAVSTELSGQTLREMVDFFQTGLISKDSAQIRDAFRCFGIDFDKLRLSQVVS